MEKIKIQDIAKELNLSRNTVAKAISSKGTVAPATRKKIVLKAVEMGYTKLPQEIADLYTGNINESKTVMILTRTDVSVFWNRVIMGINHELCARGYGVTLQFANEENEENWNIPANVCQGIAGIVVLSVYSDKFFKKYFDLNIPMVFLDTGISDSDRSFLSGDVILSEGMYAVESLTRHLIAQGAKNIGFIGDVSYCRTIRDRYDGYLLGLKSAGIAPDKSIIAKKHVPERYYFQHEVEEALSSFKFMPDAVVCANDDIALHLIKCLRARGLRVPQDVAVTGYDNLESLIQQLPPFLSTVKIQHLELGKRLAKQLLWRIENINAPKELIMVWGEVIIRESSTIRAN